MDNLFVQVEQETKPLEHNELVELVESIDAKQLAHYLAYSYPELGTELLDELQYYRNLGRI